ncbi:RloB family protein [Gluconobacter cerinus]|uniref:RloB family protein n=1 Tax=Gluconobacter cerinus TaxID=38307 RepID=UPI001B8C41C5|nr:RloB family protein [Gluconobacter cerinus]MBS1044474.1 RloB domain-containing protein [Gluconobacter cerinus]
MPRPRKPSRLKPLKTLRIFCEGERTEPNYLNGYIASLDNSLRKSVVEIEKTRKNTAVQLVEEAISWKKSSVSLPDDEFWVVYDREAVGKYSDALHAKARAKADKNGIKIALCNVCFEYWLLIHLVDTSAPFSSYDDLIHTSALCEQMKAQCNCEYDKSISSIFKILSPYLTVARERAKRLNARGRESAEVGRDQEHHINPYVGIVDLLNAIDDFD